MNELLFWACPERMYLLMMLEDMKRMRAAHRPTIVIIIEQKKEDGK